MAMGDYMNRITHSQVIGLNIFDVIDMFFFKIYKQTKDIPVVLFFK